MGEEETRAKHMEKIKNQILGCGEMVQQSVFGGPAFSDYIRLQLQEL